MASDVVPAKRNRRLVSTPLLRPTQSKPKEQLTPGKRKRRFDSTPQQGTSVGEDDTLSKIVALNCKLTNEVLVSKKQLFEKTNMLLKLQEDFHTKEIECMNLQTENAKKAAKVEELEKCIENMRSAQYCDDLIDFGAAISENQTEDEPNGVNDTNKSDVANQPDAQNTENTQDLDDSSELALFSEFQNFLRFTVILVNIIEMWCHFLGATIIEIANNKENEDPKVKEGAYGNISENDDGVSMSSDKNAAKDAPKGFAWTPTD